MLSHAPGPAPPPPPTYLSVQLSGVVVVPEDAQQVSERNLARVEHYFYAFGVRCCPRAYLLIRRLVSVALSVAHPAK